MNERDSPSNRHLAGVVRRNIAALAEARRALKARQSRELVIADAITRFAGSMRFVYLHVVLVGGWILLNVRVVPGIRPFDPFPFVMLAMFASVEAIFLSTFVLISQNRAAELAEQRAELDLQIGLLSEHEVTRLIKLVDAIAQHMGIHEEAPEQLNELKQDVRPEQVLREIEDAEHER